MVVLITAVAESVLVTLLVEELEWTERDNEGFAYLFIRIDIQSDTLAIVGELERVLVLQECDFFDLDFEDTFKQSLAEAFMSHDQLEHVVISDGNEI